MNTLRHREFRLLFLGQAASMLGDSAVLVGMEIYVARLTGSATDVGIVTGAAVLPFVLLLLVGGVWADRLPRQRIMLASDLVRGGLHTLLAALVLAGEVRVWELAVIEFGFGAARAFFQPAMTGLVPQTTPDADVIQARALLETTQNLSRLLGPAIATALVLGLGGGVLFALDAATFFVSAWFLAQMRPEQRGAPAAEGSTLALLREGFGEVRARPWVFMTILAFTLYLFSCSAPMQALGPLFARDHYGGVGVYGVFATVLGIGSVAGSVVGLRWRPRHPLATGMVLVFLFAPLPNLLLALSAPAWLVGVASLVGGFGFALLLVWWETALVRHIPPHALSRVSAWDWMGALALLPVGLFLSGPLADALSPGLVLGGGALLGFAALGAGLLPRSTRRLGAHPEPA